MGWVRCSAKTKMGSVKVHCPSIITNSMIPMLRLALIFTWCASLVFHSWIHYIHFITHQSDAVRFSQALLLCHHRFSSLDQHLISSSYHQISLNEFLKSNKNWIAGRRHCQWHTFCSRTSTIEGTNGFNCQYAQHIRQRDPSEFNGKCIETILQSRWITIADTNTRK